MKYSVLGEKDIVIFGPPQYSSVKILVSKKSSFHVFSTFHGSTTGWPLIYAAWIISKQMRPYDIDNEILKVNLICQETLPDPIID